MQQWSAMCRLRLVDGEETKQPGRRNKTAGEKKQNSRQLLPAVGGC